MTNFWISRNLWQKYIKLRANINKIKANFNKIKTNFNKIKPNIDKIKANNNKIKAKINKIKAEKDVKIYKHFDKFEFILNYFDNYKKFLIITILFL